MQSIITNKINISRTGLNMNKNKRKKILVIISIILIVFFISIVVYDMFLTPEKEIKKAPIRNNEYLEEIGKLGYHQGNEAPEVLTRPYFKQF